MKGSTNQVALVAMLAVLAGCEATTSLTTAQPGATVEVRNGTSGAVPRTETLTTTRFGNYEFRVQVFPYYEFDLEQRVVRLQRSHAIDGSKVRWSSHGTGSTG